MDNASYFRLAGLDLNAARDAARAQDIILLTGLAVAECELPMHLSRCGDRWMYRCAWKRRRRVSHPGWKPSCGMHSVPLELADWASWESLRQTLPIDQHPAFKMTTSKLAGDFVKRWFLRSNCTEVLLGSTSAYTATVQPNSRLGPQHPTTVQAPIGNALTDSGRHQLLCSADAECYFDDTIGLLMPDGQIGAIAITWERHPFGRLIRTETWPAINRARTTWLPTGHFANADASPPALEQTVLSDTGRPPTVVPATQIRCRITDTRQAITTVMTTGERPRHLNWVMP